MIQMNRTIAKRDTVNPPPPLPRHYTAWTITEKHSSAIKKEEMFGSGWSTYGYILTYFRFLNEFPLIATPGF